jgi:hypothetical protein
MKRYLSFSVAEGFLVGALEVQGRPVFLPDLVKIME